MKKSNLIFKIISLSILVIDILIALYVAVSFVLAGMRIMIINHVNFILSIIAVVINVIFISYLIISLCINKRRINTRK